MFVPFDLAHVYPAQLTGHYPHCKQSLPPPDPIYTHHQTYQPDRSLASYPLS